ncbi:MAG: hypothetical protein LBO21_04825 [Synergistaceae bacterium]|nr:hypothetical protein [Synergistaceae bacterium]
MNSIYDNSDFSIYRESRAKAAQDVPRGAALEDDGPSLWTQSVSETEVSEDQRASSALDEFESAPDSGLEDKSIYIESLLGKRAEFSNSGSAEGPFGENGCRIYMVKNIGGGRSFYLQPSGTGIEIPIGSSDGEQGGFDIMAMSMRIRAAEARYSRNFRPYAKHCVKQAKDDEADRSVPNGTASESLLPDTLFG